MVSSSLKMRIKIKLYLFWKSLWLDWTKNKVDLNWIGWRKQGEWVVRVERERWRFQRLAIPLWRLVLLLVVPVVPSHSTLLPFRSSEHPNPQLSRLLLFLATMLLLLLHPPSSFDESSTPRGFTKALHVSTLSAPSSFRPPASSSASPAASPSPLPGSPCPIPVSSLTVRFSIKATSSPRPSPFPSSATPTTATATPWISRELSKDTSPPVSLESFSKIRSVRFHQWISVFREISIGYTIPTFRWLLS